MNYELTQFNSAEELARAAASDWLKEVRAASTGAPYCVALAGGRITGRFFSAVVEQAKGQHISLAAIHFFWSDERCVPPTDPESNFTLARERLCAHKKDVRIALAGLE